MLVLLRHAHAGDKRRWTGPDQSRPLSDRGKRQASALPARLSRLDVTAILSSPTLRCLETVRSLAAVREIPITQMPLLEPGADLNALLELLPSRRVRRSAAFTSCSFRLRSIRCWTSRTLAATSALAVAHLLSVPDAAPAASFLTIWKPAASLARTSSMRALICSVVSSCGVEVLPQCGDPLF